MPTRRTLLILSVAAPLFALAGANRWAAVVAILVDGAVLALFFLDRRRLPRAPHVRMERRHGRVLSLAEPNRVELELTNASRRPLRGLLQDNPPAGWRREPERLAVSLPPRSAARLAYNLTPLERGRFSFASAVLRAEGPLGLAFRDYHLSGRAEEAGEGVGESFTVYPSVRSSVPRQIAAFARQMESGYHRLQRQVEGTTPAQIRKWSPGDSYRDINWKATARHDQPMVTQHDVDTNQAIVLFLDCGRLMRAPAGQLTKLDRAVNACADLARVAIDRGDMVGLCCFSHTVRLWLDAGGKRRQLRRLLEGLATVRADANATDYDAPLNTFLARAKRRTLCLFLTCLSECEGAWRFMHRLRSLRPRHLPAVISLAEPDLARAFRERPRGYLDACAQLALADIREEMALFADTLRLAGGYFLEVDADSLSLAVVQTYLDAKSRGAL